MISEPGASGRPVFYLHIVALHAGFQTRLLDSSQSELIVHQVSWSGRLQGVIAELETLSGNQVAWIRSTEAVSTQADLNALGTVLLDEIAGPTLKAYLTSARHTGGFHLCLVIETPQLRDVPWEALSDGLGCFGASENIFLSRHARLEPLGEDLESPLRLSVLFAGVQAEDSPPQMDLAVGQEREAIGRALAAAELEGTAVYRWQSRASLESLAASLLRDAPRVLHLSGHGDINPETAAPMLLLESESGKEERVNVDALLERCRSNPPNILFLSNCYSLSMGSDDFYRATLERATAIGIPFIIGMRNTILDAAAREFAESFYRSLAAGHSMHGAINRARARLALMGFPTGQWTIPVLYSTGILLDLRYRPTAAPGDSTAVRRVELDGLPRLGEDLFGRERDLRRIIRLLQDPGVGGVAVTGAVGQGKTSLAVAVGTSLGDEFEAVIGVDCSLLDGAPALASRLAMDIERLGWRGRARTLHGSLRNRKALFLLDGVDRLGSGLKDVLSSLLREPAVKCLLTCRGDVILSSLPRRLEVYRLGELAPSWVQQLAARIRGVPWLEAEEARRLYQSLGGHPLSHVLAAESQMGAEWPDVETAAAEAVRLLARDTELRQSWGGLEPRLRRFARHLAVLPLPVDTAGVEAMAGKGFVEADLEALERRGLLDRTQDGRILLQRAFATSLLQSASEADQAAWRRAAAKVFARLFRERRDLRYGFTSLLLDPAPRDLPLWNSVVTGYLVTGRWRELQKLSLPGEPARETDLDWKIDQPLLQRFLVDRHSAWQLARRQRDELGADASPVQQAHLAAIAGSLTTEGVEAQVALWELALLTYRSLEQPAGVRRSLAGLSQASSELGENLRSLQLAEQAWETPGAGEDPLEGVVLGFVQARTWLENGHVEEARGRLSHLLRHVQENGWWALRPGLLQGLAHVMVQQGRHLAARDLCVIARAVAEELGFAEARSASLYGLAGSENRLGRYQEAAVLLTEALEIFSSQGQVLESAAAHYERSLTQGQGDLDRCLALAPASGSRRLLVTALLRRLWLLAWEGFPERAREEHGDLPVTESRLLNAAAAFVLGDIEAALFSSPETSLARYEQAAQGFSEAGFSLGVAAAMTRRGCTVLETDPSAAIAAWRDAFSILDGLGNRRAGDVLAMLATGARQLGDRSDQILAEPATFEAAMFTRFAQATSPSLLWRQDAGMPGQRAAFVAEGDVVSVIERPVTMSELLIHAVHGRAPWAAEKIRTYRFDLELPFFLWNLPEVRLIASGSPEQDQLHEVP